MKAYIPYSMQKEAFYFYILFTNIVKGKGKNK